MVNGFVVVKSIRDLLYFFKMSSISKKKNRKSGSYYRRLKAFSEMYNRFDEPAQNNANINCVALYRCNATLNPISENNDASINENENLNTQCVATQTMIDLNKWMDNNEEVDEIDHLCEEESSDGEIYEVENIVSASGIMGML